jgi:hypothetical protein
MESLVGVGWAYIFENKTIASKQDSYNALVEAESKIPAAIKTLLDEVQAGDFIWLHKGGEFFLCKIKDNECVLGPQIADNFQEYDLGHGRNADWVKVSPLLVPGRVQRSTIAQRMIQRISSSDAQQRYFGYIHTELSKDPEFLPRVDEEEVAQELETISPDQFVDLLGPDDCEGLVAAFLQAKGWTLILSTAYKSKPMFEFTMVRPGPPPEYAHVQVKSGSVPLSPLDFKKFTSGGECVFLFSTAPNPYPGEALDRVYTLNPKDVLGWAGKNAWALLPGIKLQLSLCYRIGSHAAH